MKTVFITGIAGFLGRYAAREFSRRGWSVTGVDVAPPENAPPAISYFQMPLPSAALGELLRAQQPAVFIHCAGRASVPLSMEDPASDFRDNTVLAFEMLEALRVNAPRCRFLLLSSAAVYGNPESLPVSEAHRIAPLSPYGYHKRQCELLCEEYSSIYGIASGALRIFSAYGPGLRRQVIWDICERILRTGRLQLRGTGNESRDFIHAADVAKALAQLAENMPDEGGIYNVATGREVTIAHLATLVSTALGSTVQAEFDGQAAPGQPLNWRAEISAIAALGFVPGVSLEQGLSGVAAWCKAELGIA